MNKNYLMMTDEVGMAALQQVFSGTSVRFLEVQGMNMQASGVNILVTPIIPPVAPMVPVPVPPSIEEKSNEVGSE